MYSYQAEKRQDIKHLNLVIRPIVSDIVGHNRYTLSKNYFIGNSSVCTTGIISGDESMT